LKFPTPKLGLKVTLNS